jgi:hypothetical protein
MLDGGQSLAADNPSLAARLDVRKRSEARMSQVCVSSDARVNYVCL